MLQGILQQGVIMGHQIRQRCECLQMRLMKRLLCPVLLHILLVLRAGYGRMVGTNEPLFIGGKLIIDNDCKTTHLIVGCFVL